MPSTIGRKTYYATGTNFRSVLFHQLLNKTPATPKSHEHGIPSAGALGIHRGIHDRWASGIFNSLDEEKTDTVPKAAASMPWGGEASEVTLVDDLPDYEDYELDPSPEPMVKQDMSLHSVESDLNIPLEQSVEENVCRVMAGQTEREDDGVEVATKEPRFTRAPTPFNHSQYGDESDSPLEQQAHPGDELPREPDDPAEGENLHEPADNKSDSVLNGDEEDQAAAKDMDVARDYNQWLENEPIQEELDANVQQVRVLCEVAGLLDTAVDLIDRAASLLRQSGVFEAPEAESDDNHQYSQDEDVKEALIKSNTDHPASQPEGDVEGHIYDNDQGSVSHHDFDRHSTRSEHTVYPELVAEAWCRGIPADMIPRPVFFPNGHIDYNRTFNALESDYESGESDEDLSEGYGYENTAPARSGHLYSDPLKTHVEDESSCYESKVSYSSRSERSGSKALNGSLAGGKQHEKAEGEKEEKTWGEKCEERYQRRILELDQLDADVSHADGTEIAPVQQASQEQLESPEQAAIAPPVESPLKHKHTAPEYYKQLGGTEKDATKPPTENHKRKRFMWKDYAADVQPEMESEEERGRSRTRRRLNFYH